MRRNPASGRTPSTTALSALEGYGWQRSAAWQRAQHSRSVDIASKIVRTILIGSACRITSEVFQASDLAGAKRREFLGAAREGGALLRDTDGFALTMIPLAQLEAITEVARTAVAALLAVATLGREFVRPAELGPLAWLVVFDDDDRAEFFAELRDALALAEATRDAAPVETCLREWRTTARALADPQRQAILAGPGDDDYAEVSRPQE
jgi:hypothetical protein